jgi:hypothetical protein
MINSEEAIIKLQHLHPIKKASMRTRLKAEVRTEVKTEWIIERKTEHNLEMRTETRVETSTETKTGTKTRTSIEAKSEMRAEAARSRGAAGKTISSGITTGIIHPDRIIIIPTSKARFPAQGSAG